MKFSEDVKILEHVTWLLKTSRHLEPIVMTSETFFSNVTSSEFGKLLHESSEDSEACHVASEAPRHQNPSTGGSRRLLNKWSQTSLGSPFKFSKIRQKFKWAICSASGPLAGPPGGSNLNIFKFSQISPSDAPGNLFRVRLPRIRKQFLRGANWSPANFENICLFVYVIWQEEKCGKQEERNDHYQFYQLSVDLAPGDVDQLSIWSGDTDFGFGWKKKWLEVIRT